MIPRPHWYSMQAISFRRCVLHETARGERKKGIEERKEEKDRNPTTSRKMKDTTSRKIQPRER